jgi:hypothetical protein
MKGAEDGLGDVVEGLKNADYYKIRAQTRYMLVTKKNLRHPVKDLL